MDMPPDSNDDDAEREIAAQAIAMKDQLRKDVAFWSKARHDGTTGLATTPDMPAPKPPAPKRVARAARPAAVAPKPADTSGKPFRMSYSGSSTAEYIKYMRDRGAK
jgi:anti-sigma factor RsiW